MNNADFHEFVEPSHQLSHNHLCLILLQKATPRSQELKQITAIGWLHYQIVIILGRLMFNHPGNILTPRPPNQLQQLDLLLQFNFVVLKVATLVNNGLFHAVHGDLLHCEYFLQVVHVIGKKHFGEAPLTQLHAIC